MLLANVACAVVAVVAGIIGKIYLKKKITEIKEDTHLSNTFETKSEVKLEQEIIPKEVLYKYNT